MFARLFGLMLGLVIFAVECRAACTERPLGESKESYLQALLTRMRAVGVKGVLPVKQNADTQMYVMQGTDVRVAVSAEGGLLTRVVTVLSAPTKAEIDRLLTVGAFTVARFSDIAEAVAKSQLYNELEKVVSAKPGLKRWGN